MTTIKAGYMYYADIFLTIQDLMKLMGSNNYESARRRHKSIRDALGRNRGTLTIREFCEFEQADYVEVWTFLRDTPPFGPE